MQQIILIIMSLLSPTVLCQQGQYQYHEEVSLVNRLNFFFGFDHNIFLLDSSTDPNLWISTKDNNFTPQTVYIFDHNLDNENSTVLAISESAISKNPFIIIVTMTESFKSYWLDTQLVALLNKIFQFKVNVKLGVFFVNEVTSMDVIDDLFVWSRHFHAGNIVTAFYSHIDSDPNLEPSFHVYRILRFGINFINVTDNESLRYYFSERIPNYQQNSILFYVNNDYINFDYAMPFWEIVIDVFNASIQLIQSSAVPNPELNDIFPYELTLVDLQIYPYGVSTLVLLVPHAQPYSGFLEYLKNATWKLLLAHTLIVITLSSVLLTVSGYLQTKKIALFQCVADVINLLMNDNGDIRYGQLHRANVFIVVPLTFTGLIVVNGILSVFQSYLTVPIYERQIKTIEDLFESSVPILAQRYYWKDRTVETLTNISQHNGWNDKVHAMFIDHIMEEVHKFNNSAAFAILYDEARLFLVVQKRLDLKAYYLITEMNLAKKFLTFHLSNSHNDLFEPMSDVIHRMQSGGLIDKWYKDKEDEKIEEIWKQNYDVKFKTSDPSENYVPTVVWCGWIASVIVFICELIWSKYEPQIEKLKKKLCVVKIFKYLLLGFEKLLN